MGLHEMATVWARANCLSADVQDDILRHVDRAIQRNVGCSFTVGDSLTKNQRSFLISCFSGEFFAFELTHSQVVRLGVKTNELDFAASVPREALALNSEPTVWLQEVKVDHATGLSSEVPITGSLRYQTEQSVLQPLAIRVVFEPLGRDRITLFHHLSRLTPQEGIVKFALRQLGDLLARGGQPFTGVVPLFFQVWAANKTSGRQLPTPVLPRVGGHVMRPDVSRKPQMPTTGTVPTPSSAGHLPPPESTALPDQPISDIRAVIVEVI
jgi:hypothetical protein